MERAAPRPLVPAALVFQALLVGGLGLSWRRIFSTSKPSSVVDGITHPGAIYMKSPRKSNTRRKHTPVEKAAKTAKTAATKAAKASAKAAKPQCRLVAAPHALAHGTRARGSQIREPGT
jgi:hypothetical protein